MPVITAQEYKEKVQQLKQKVTPKFLEILIEGAKLIGWCGDYSETCDFIVQLNDLLGINMDELRTKLEPYEIDLDSIYGKGD